MLKLPDGIIYNPDFFNPGTFEDAKRVVLGYGLSETENKWEIETRWNINLFKTKNFINKESVVLDWGCGVGRLSKVIIENFGCRVVGVDLSQKMLEYARENVNSENFTTLTVDEYKNIDIKFTEAIAVWTVQHSIDPDGDIKLIKQNLLKEGKLFVFEETHPCLPTNGDSPWYILRASNFNRFDKNFTIVEHGKFPEIYNIPENNKAWWGFFKNK